MLAILLLTFLVIVGTVLYKFIQSQQPQIQKDEEDDCDNDDYKCPICWSTLRVPVFIIFQWGGNDHLCTLTKRWCLQCVRSYFEFNKSQKAKKGCLHCGCDSTTLPKNKHEVYRLDKRLMNEMTERKIISKCECGESFANQWDLYQHLLKDCNYSYCAVCRLEFGVDNTTSLRHNKCVNYAITNNNTEMLKLLLSNKRVCINRQSGKGFVQATHNNNLEMVQIILESGAKFICEKALSEGLLNAVKNNNIDMFRLLLNYGARVTHHYQSLIHAVKRNSVEMTCLLIDRATFTDFEYSSALLHASQNNNLDIAKILIQNGGKCPSCESENNDANHPMYHAMIWRSFPMVKLLYESLERKIVHPDYLLDAVCFDCEDITRFMLERNVKYRGGKILTMASQKGNTNIVELLLLNLEFDEKQIQNAIQKASKYCHDEVIEYLKVYADFISA